MFIALNIFGLCVLFKDWSSFYNNHWGFIKLPLFLFSKPTLIYHQMVVFFHWRSSRECWNPSHTGRPNCSFKRAIYLFKFYPYCVCCIICHIECNCMLSCVWCPNNALSFACSYGMRYIAKVLKNSLHEKFPEASEDELLKVEMLRCWNQIMDKRCLCFTSDLFVLY